MKKLIVIILTISVMLICFTGCKDENSIVGTWSSSGDEPSNYPGIITMHEEGTGLADGFNLNWYTNGNRLTLSIALFGQESYTYEVLGDFLKLDGYVYTRE